MVPAFRNYVLRVAAAALAVNVASAQTKSTSPQVAIAKFTILSLMVKHLQGKLPARVQLASESANFWTASIFFAGVRHQLFAEILLFLFRRTRRALQGPPGLVGLQSGPLPGPRRPPLPWAP